LSSLQHGQLMTERDDLGPHHRLTLNAGSRDLSNIITKLAMIGGDYSRKAEVQQ